MLAIICVYQIAGMARSYNLRLEEYGAHPPTGNSSSV
jgi:hypothetical protein